MKSRLMGDGIHKKDASPPQPFDFDKSLRMFL